MKSLGSWHDLEPFGIVFLTGEACGLSLRFLCDVTRKGRSVLEAAFGLPCMNLAEPWNTGSKDDPHVGSILLPPELFATLAIFALLESNHLEAWACKNGTVLGFDASDTPECIEQSARFLEGDVSRKFSYRGTARDRNVHVMSGHIE